MSSRRGSVSSTGGTHKDISGVPAATKKFLNGWTPEQERLMAQWADVAGCYRWLHDRSEKKYTKLNMYITIPVIILSTLTGTANFALDSFIEKDNYSAKTYAQATIGGISIFAGILTTLGNFLRFAQGSEAHRVASVAWGKFQRQITVEISIHPNDRMDCMDFLHICRQDLDRLIEQSPPIPDDIIAVFEVEFKNSENLKRPDICHGLEHTVAYNSTKPRLMKMVADATIYLKQRKKLLRDDILPDISERITLAVQSELDKKMGDMEKRRNAEAAAAVQEPEPPVSSFHYSGNWRRLIGVGKSDSVRPNMFAEHEEVVEVDEEVLNEIISTSPKEMIINMKVDEEVQNKVNPPISHTMHFD
jgi:hypothetical protein